MGKLFPGNQLERAVMGILQGSVLSGARDDSQPHFSEELFNILFMGANSNFPLVLLLIVLPKLVGTHMMMSRCFTSDVKLYPCKLWKCVLSW